MRLIGKDSLKQSIYLYALYEGLSYLLALLQNARQLIHLRLQVLLLLFLVLTLLAERRLYVCVYFLQSPP